MNRRTIRNGLLALALCSLAIFLPAHRSEAQVCSPACQQCMAQAAQYQYACYIACTYSSFCPCTVEQVNAMFAYCNTL